MVPNVLDNTQQPILAGFPDSSISTYHASTYGTECNEPHSTAQYIGACSLGQLRAHIKLPDKHDERQEEVVWIDYHPPPKDEKLESLL